MAQWLSLHLEQIFDRHVTTILTQKAFKTQAFGGKQ